MAAGERQHEPAATAAPPEGLPAEEDLWAQRPLGDEDLLLDAQLDHEETEGGAPWYAVLAVVVALGIGLLVVTTGLGAETPFYTVDEAVAAEAVEAGARLRIKGIVEPGSVTGSPGEIGRSFAIAEKGKSLRVQYDRALPDTFQEGMEVVAEGEVGDDGVLVADEVLVKCPSRYEGQAPTAEGGVVGGEAGGPGPAAGAPY